MIFFKETFPCLKMIWDYVMRRKLLIKKKNVMRRKWGTSFNRSVSSIQIDRSIKSDGRHSICKSLKETNPNVKSNLATL
jgi:hypothetical protein